MGATYRDDTPENEDVNVCFKPYDSFDLGSDNGEGKADLFSNSQTSQLGSGMKRTGQRCLGIGLRG